MTLEKKQSDITGDGYGSEHNWEAGYTNQSRFREDRATLYTCRKCKIRFYHFYHVTPDIFEEIKKNNIPEKCAGKSNDA